MSIQSKKLMLLEVDKANAIQNIFKKSKILIYCTLIQPVVTYDVNVPKEKN